jgi:hypothetical protein
MKMIKQIKIPKIKKNENLIIFIAHTFQFKT